MIKHIYVFYSDEDMQSIASLMSIGRPSDIGDMRDLEEEDDAEDDTASRISDVTASRISEMTSAFYVSVSEEDGSAQAMGLTNGPTTDHSMLLSISRVLLFIKCDASQKNPVDIYYIIRMRLQS